MLSENYITGISIDWDANNSSDFYSSIPSIKSTRELELNSKVTFFVGENGSGKSTLLEGIAVNYGFNPEGGSINYNFSTKDSHSSLSDIILLKKGFKRAKDGFFLRAESFYNVATYVEENLTYDECGGTSLHSQSHGESFMSLISNRFRGEGLYILDEPEAALSPQMQLSLLILINELSKNSQFIIVTHSPILLGLPGSEIYLFDSNIQKVDYQDTESYQITKLFIEDREQLLKRIL